MKTVYIAGPFRGRNSFQVYQNVFRAETLMHEVIDTAFKEGLTISVLCPHSMSLHLDRTFTDQYWLDATMEWLIRSDSILMVEGWEKSEGARGEHLRALQMKKPVFYNVPGLLEWLRESR